MKVIDLLNKIANGEEVPEKIKWEDTIYVYSEYDKDYIEFPISVDEYKGLFNMKDSILTQYLNDEIEIIEDTPKVQVEMTQEEYNEYLDRKLNTPKEDKRIEKLDLSDWWEITSSEDCKPEMLAKIFNKNAKTFSSKINEIIDKVNHE